MSSSLSFTIPLFLLLTVFLFTLSSASENNLRHGNHLPSIHILNALLPGNSDSISSTIQIRCKSRGKSLGVRTLNAGEGYRWSIKQRAVHFCEALWGREIAAWHAYQPRRDDGHGEVLWAVKESGFYLSWDNNSTWVRKSVWETE